MLVNMLTKNTDGTFSSSSIGIVSIVLVLHNKTLFTSKSGYVRLGEVYKYHLLLVYSCDTIKALHSFFSSGGLSAMSPCFAEDKAYNMAAQQHYNCFSHAWPLLTNIQTDVSDDYIIVY